VRTVPGDPAALKITTSIDLLTVAALVGQHVG
jgi:2-C-methyl-D-erythritol 4-phosphate cytidylyltransferase